MRKFNEQNTRGTRHWSYLYASSVFGATSYTLYYHRAVLLMCMDKEERERERVALRSVPNTIESGY